MTKPFWNKKWGKKSICPISQTRLRPGKNKFGIPYTICLPCSHRFYRRALFTWVKKIPNNPTCPICRKKIFLIDLVTMKN